MFLQEHDTDVVCNACLAFGVLITLIAILSLVFLSSPFVPLIMALDLTSITCGSIGLMSLWGIPLNSMTIQVILVSLPYAATICFAASYHFLNNSFANDRERSAFAFVAFAGPTLKSGFVILCGFLPLLAVPAPFVGDMTKLIFITIGLIALHSLIFLPPILPLLAINLPLCCNQCMDQCNKGCVCCSADEDVSSIYYIPTGAKEIQVEEIEKIYASLRLHESTHGQSQLALPAPIPRLALPDIGQVYPSPRMDLDLIPTAQRRSQPKRDDLSIESRKKSRKESHDRNVPSRPESRMSRRTKSSPPNSAHQVSTSPSGDERNRSPQLNRGSKLRTSTSSMIKAERREKIDRERRRSLVEPPTYLVEEPEDHRLSNKMSYANWSRQGTDSADAFSTVSGRYCPVMPPDCIVEMRPEWAKSWLHGSIRGAPPGFSMSPAGRVMARPSIQDASFFIASMPRHY